MSVTENSKSKKHKRNQTGTISPVMCVDKLPEELSTFPSFVGEADNITKEWDF